ncbi:hypothetical protein FHR33_009000 [Nonomuraea dietziae]|uniref:Uncharacterized protein n=1 Tax=Nonomuraea dietziae TaxID=65515 RepID=A0A7W5YCE8_9ACTN|nr:hypothetical protein [Nonomuraea dietziae]
MSHVLRSAESGYDQQNCFTREIRAHDAGASRTPPGGVVMPEFRDRAAAFA